MTKLHFKLLFVYIEIGFKKYIPCISWKMNFSKEHHLEAKAS